ncbi:putative cytochrome c oxidase subunit 6b-like [Rosa rugosa]|uniref:putative cytochrome c oxidase subunit 6b-like n=1 Tax=Rosa rugosa TaxID=74645 RepID=UPI002B40308E|nr:putative cytochrome c oxidase subunit 6b-like [Rosa rugosa]
MSAAQVEPHDKMRSRDVNKVARGEQAPRPAHEYGSIKSAPPKPTPTPPPRPSSPPPSYKEEVEDEHNPVARHCYASYWQFHKCIKDKGDGAPQCVRFEKNYKILCPLEWIERWDEDQKRGVLVIE